MDEFLSIFGVYEFAIRDALVLCPVALAIYVLLSAGIFAAGGGQSARRGRAAGRARSAW